MRRVGKIPTLFYAVIVVSIFSAITISLTETSKRKDKAIILSNDGIVSPRNHLYIDFVLLNPK